MSNKGRKKIQGHEKVSTETQQKQAEGDKIADDMKNFSMYSVSAYTVSLSLAVILRFIMHSHNMEGVVLCLS